MIFLVGILHFLNIYALLLPSTWKRGLRTRGFQLELMQGDKKTLP